MERPKRDLLYEEVWREPMTTVAARYGVSSNYLARICERLNVPRPARGYWAKLSVGKATARPPLPESLVADHPEIDKSRPRVLVAADGERSAQTRGKPGQRARTHPLLGGAKPLYLKGRVHDSGLLKPNKRLLPDLLVSEASLDAALALANELFNRLEDAGHHVVVAPQGQRFRRSNIEVRDYPTKQEERYRRLWMPDRATVASVDRVAIGISVFEMTDEIEMQYLGSGKYVPVAEISKVARARTVPSWSWTSKEERPSGRLCILTYCPYSTGTWERRWVETNQREWPAKIAELVDALPQIAAEIAELVRQGDLAAEAQRRKWEEEHQRYELERHEEQFRQATAKSMSDLRQIIRDWSEHKAVEAFLDEAARSIEVANPTTSHSLVDRLAKARAFLGNTDPLAALVNWKTPEERLTSGAASN